MSSYLVTGGSGAFGQAFVRRLLETDAKRIVVFSRSEAKQAEMNADLRDERIRYMIGDVRDLNRLMDACRGVETVVHAAALKRVETCEADPNEAVQTNVLGTANLARVCIERGVRRAVFLSTDKAAAPNTLYGATKLNAERLWLASNIYAGSQNTRLSATRYGNVIGSTGSVLTVWRNQVATGDPLSITDQRMSRFWMTMEQAVDLVLLAIHSGRGGEVFVPKIRAMRVVAMAEAFAPGHPQRFTGIRPGEKLHETLITEDESRRTFDCGGHYVIEPDERPWGNVETLPFPKVPEGFEYRSDTAELLAAETIREVAA